MTGELEYYEPLHCCEQASILEHGREWGKEANSTRKCQVHDGTHLEGLDCTDTTAIGFSCPSNQTRDACINLHVLKLMSFRRAKKDLSSLDSDLQKFCCKPS